MGRMSRSKGARGEREAAAAIREHLGIDASRGRQYQGGDDSPDVKAAIPGVHIEVKRVESLNVHAAMVQAAEDAGPTLAPVVLSRRNRGPWLVHVRLEDLTDLANALDAAWAKSTTRVEE